MKSYIQSCSPSGRKAALLVSPVSFQGVSGPWVVNLRTPSPHASQAIASKTLMSYTSSKGLGLQVSATRRSKGRGALQCRAFSLPDSVDATLRNIVSISSVVGISYAVLLAAVSTPPSLPPAPHLPPGADRRALGPGADVSKASAATGPAARGAGVGRGSDGPAEDDNFVWGLMGFISFLPLFNWLAWVLAALSDEDRAVLYGTYAALYGTPLLLRGLDWQDPWCLFMLLLCVVHVQAERIAQTEPETLRSIRPVGAVGALLRGAVGGTGAFLSGLGGVLAEDSRRAVRRPGGSSDRAPTQPPAQPPAQLGPGEDRLQLGRDPDLVRRGVPIQDPRRDPSRDPDSEEFAVRELRQFDEQLRQAEQKKGKERRHRDGGK